MINTARGILLPDDLLLRSLLRSLDSGKVAMAAHDVWPREPVPANDPLSMHPRILATPACRSESIFELQKAAASQVASVLIGDMPCNVVNAEVLQTPQLRARSIRTRLPVPGSL